MKDIEEKIKLELEKANLNNEVPNVAILLNEKDELVSIAYNERNRTNKISNHAEIIAIEKFAIKNNSWNLKGFKIIVTLEPCLMCTGAIIQSKISNIYFYVKNEKMGYILSNHSINLSNIKVQQIENKTSDLIKDKLNNFFKLKRNDKNE
ncbi:nucleoside deaminase [Spiroplasma endosymbiont of Amphibalanus improvisus]|uniref:nucleoside deaminase n=1 Tax=Spiroplasma endosymbiont of Amphibalanus improvisus TaxID=3066327 RepID=UPI00313DB16F